MARRETMTAWMRNATAVGWRPKKAIALRAIPLIRHR
jgi:hypothetical protein